MASVTEVTPISRADNPSIIFEDYTTIVPDNRSVYVFGPRGSTWESCTTWFTTVPGSFAQASFLFFCVSYMAGGANSEAVIFRNVCNALAFLFMMIWAAGDICAPDVVAWSVFLGSVVVIQIVLQVQRSRKLSEILEAPGIATLYSRFTNLSVSEQLFADLVTCKGCERATLKKGENYSLEGKTSVDRVSILMSGRLSVYCKDKFLHFIGPNSFIDSPEWDSLRNNSSKKLIFKVTITADCECKIITWRRKSLVALLTKRKRLGMLFQHMIGRDITGKLMGLNDRQMTAKGFRYDIRLPCVISLAQDIKRRNRERTLSTPGTPMDAEGRKQRHKRMGRTAAAKYSNILASKIAENKAKPGKSQLLKTGD